jgi:chromosomal replication initiator protein
VTEVGADRVDLWLGDGVRLDWTGETLRITADTAFRVDSVRKRLLLDIRRVLSEELGERAEITFAVDASMMQPVAAAAERSAELAIAEVEARAVNGAACAATCEHPHATWTGSSPGNLGGSGAWSRPAARPRRFASLDTFVEGDCNRVARGAVKFVVEHPGQINPLFVHGPCGVGKTHLLEGIWSEVRRRGGRRIIYLTAEQFTIYFLQALRGSGLPNFRQKYRGVDLLILDDVQFFAGKQATITEVLHTLDALQRESSQIVLAADRPPAELTVLGSELQARIGGGLACPMHPLDVETRRTLLDPLIERRQLLLDAAARDRIAQRVPGDARQMIGLLNRLWATSQTLQCTPSLAMIDDVLDELFPRTGGMIKLEDIERVVCDEFGLEPALLRSDKRSRSVSHPRMLAMFLARKLTHAALTEIGEFFGRRSHSTVLSAQQKVEDWVERGQQLKCDKSQRDVRTLLSRLERNLRA